jgi:hypothetical protein
VHKFGFAWALMAGVADDLTTHATSIADTAISISAR